MMRVAAILRLADPRPEVDPLTGAVTTGRAAMGAADAAALEHALRIGTQVLAVGVGEDAAALREAAALGAQTIRIAWPDDALFADERPLARALAGVTRDCDAVIFGDMVALPAFLAHELGAAQALGLVSLRADGRALVAERRLDGGRRERLRIPLPAVCSVEAAGVRLRRAPLPALLEARPATRAIAVRAEEVRVEAIFPGRPRTRVVAPPAGDARARVLALTGALVAHEPPVIVEPVDAAEAADALLEFLDRNGYR